MNNHLFLCNPVHFPLPRKTYSAGDADYSFSVQSCSKVFTMALVMDVNGTEAVYEKIGVEPTGLPFNSITALGLHDKRPSNPLVNAGVSG